MNKKIFIFMFLGICIALFSYKLAVNSVKLPVLVKNDASPTPICKNVSLDQAIEEVYKLSEVKDYFNEMKGEGYSPNLVGLDWDNEGESSKVWAVKLANDNGIVNSASNHYMVDKCTGKIKCQMWEGEKESKSFPCN